MATFREMAEKHLGPKVLEKFLNNMKNGGVDMDRDVSDSLFVISSAFSWDKTPEGFLYWNDVHGKWLAAMSARDKKGIKNEKK